MERAEATEVGRPAADPCAVGGEETRPEIEDPGAETAAVVETSDNPSRWAVVLVAPGDAEAPEVVVAVLAVGLVAGADPASEVAVDLGVEPGVDGEEDGAVTVTFVAGVVGAAAAGVGIAGVVVAGAALVGAAVAGAGGVVAGAVVAGVVGVVGAGFVDAAVGAVESSGLVVLSGSVVLVGSVLEFPDPGPPEPEPPDPEPPDPDPLEPDALEPDPDAAASDAQAVITSSPMIAARTAAAMPRRLRLTIGSLGCVRTTAPLGCGCRPR